MLYDWGACTTVGGKEKWKLNETYWMWTHSWEYRYRLSNTAGDSVQLNKPTRMNNRTSGQAKRGELRVCARVCLRKYIGFYHATWKCNRSGLISVLQQIKCCFFSFLFFSSLSLTIDRFTPHLLLRFTSPRRSSLKWALCFQSVSLKSLVVSVSVSVLS